MRIENSHYLNFKSVNPQDKRVAPQSTETMPEPVLSSPSAEVLRAYNLADIKKGIDNAIITPDYDSTQLIYNIKALSPHTQKVKFTYTIDNDENQREAFSSSKNIKTGEFRVAIPVLNRKNNSIVKEVKINSVQYFDETNLKIDEETPEDMKVKPEELMQIKEPRTTIIEGESSTAEFDSISEGVSIGKLVEMEYEDVIRYKQNEPIIAILPEKDMNTLLMEIPEGTFSLPMNVKGVLASPKHYKQGGMLTDCLGHAVSRLRGRKTFALVDKNTIEKIKANYLDNHENPFIKVELDTDKMKISGLQELPPVDSSSVKVPKCRLVDRLLTPDDSDFTPDAVGLKAFNLGELKKIQKKGGFKVPKFFVFPAGVWDKVKKSPENSDTYGTCDTDVEKIGGYHFCVKKADNAENPINELKGIRRLIVEDMVLSKEIRTQLKEKAEQVFDIPRIVEQKGCLIARSSFNGEDSDTMATQGLYDSFPGIRTAENLYKAIKEVEASKWSDLAFISRRNHGIKHSAIQGNVIIQEVVPVDYTFTINTADPRKNNKNKMVAQLSQGVYSCFPNSPYIFEYDKTSGDIVRKALASKKRTKPIEKIVMDDFANTKYELTDYSKDPLNMAKKYYEPIMKKVFEVAQFIENHCDGRPQDIEGGIIFKENNETGELEPEIHIWQTRDVHLIKR